MTESNGTNFDRLPFCLLFMNNNFSFHNSPKELKLDVLGICSKITARALL